MSGDGLPKGWAKAKIGDLIAWGGVFCDGDWIESEDQDPEGDVRLIQLADIGDGKYRDKSHRFLTARKADELNCTFLEEGDVLIARMPDPLGRACIFPGDDKAAVTAVDICIVRTATDEVNHKCLMWFVNSPQIRERIASLQSGSTRKRISRKNLGTIALSLPPSSEQHRIVAKIEELFSDLDAGVAALERAKANLKRYRAAVLKAAVEGTMTAEWRAKNPPKETAGQLLERILKERRQKWEEAQLAAFAKANKEPPKNWKDKYREPQPPDTSSLPELPDGWCWSCLGQLKTWAMYGPRFSSDEYADDGVLVLRTTDFTDSGRINLDTPPRMPLTVGQLDKYRVEPGDLLVTRTGSLGTAAVFTGGADVIAGAFLIHYRLPVGSHLTWYIFYFLKSPTGQQCLVAGGAGVGRPNLNMPKIDGIPFPLPPFDEQKQIIAEVERRLSLADEAELQLAANHKRSTRLRQSILKRAFEGKLVPQDPSDEPASKLLERIKAERESLANPNNKSKKRKQEAAP